MRCRRRAGLCSAGGRNHERSATRIRRIPSVLVTPPIVREHQDVEQLGAWSRTERVEALLKAAFELMGTHGRRLRHQAVGSGIRVSRGSVSASLRGRVRQLGVEIAGNVVRPHPQVQSARDIRLLQCVQPDDSPVLGDGEDAEVAVTRVEALDL